MIDLEIEILGQISLLEFKGITYVMVIAFSYCLILLYYNIKNIGGLKEFLKIIFCAIENCDQGYEESE